MYGRTRDGRTYLTERAKLFKEQTGWEARIQYKGKPLTGPLSVEVALFWPTRAKHDLDNLKALYDALNGIIYEDDGQIQQLVVAKAVDAEDPHVEMRVLEL